MAERIKSLAKERQWPVNDVVLNALRYGLGMSVAGQVLSRTLLDSDSQADEQWDAMEKAVFQEAVQALAVARPTCFAAAPDS